MAVRDEFDSQDDAMAGHCEGAEQWTDVDRAPGQEQWEDDWTSDPEAVDEAYDDGGAGENGAGGWEGIGAEQSYEAIPDSPARASARTPRGPASSSVPKAKTE